MGVWVPGLTLWPCRHSRLRQVYRDYVQTKSTKFLEDMWPVVLHVMQVAALDALASKPICA